MVNTKPTFVPLLSKNQKVLHAFFVITWLLSLLYFWDWWLQQKHVSTTWGILINSFVLTYSTVLPIWFHLFSLRMTKVNPKLSIPKKKVAIITTKTPSESLTVLRNTLKGMLLQKYPYAYDVWLADEQPDEATKQWCKENRVKISTRYKVKEYHQPKWPRRTRSKEGNLAYFYDHFGYKNYDIVVQLDADHVPNPNYLANMVRPFSDEKIGYVAAPSICDSNKDSSWSARGRLYSEASTHGALQAAFNSGFAPLCIGSHYAVRTKALEQVGGIGPELAEDHSTTLWLNSGGWEGAFAIDAEAHGDGPEYFTDCITQEFQWSRSIITILIRYAPEKFKTLSFKKQFQFLFSEVWYILLAISMLIGYILPFLALISKKPLVSISYIEYIQMIFLVTLASLLPSAMIQKSGALRPKTSKLMSIELFMFQLARWPWVLKGVLHGIYAGLTHKELPFKVTEKGKKDFDYLPTKAIRPYVLLSIVAALSALIIQDAGAASGYYFIALVNAIIYYIVTLYVLSMHSYEKTKRINISSKQFIIITINLAFIILAAYFKGNILWFIL